jgi:hypothetical protein
MNFGPPPLSAADIYPLDTVFRDLADHFPPAVPFQYIIKRLLDVAQIRPLFFMCDPSSQLETDTVKDLGIEDQLVFMVAPVYSRDPVTRGAVLPLPNVLRNTKAAASTQIDYFTFLIELPNGRRFHRWDSC